MAFFSYDISSLIGSNPIREFKGIAKEGKR